MKKKSKIYVAGHDGLVGSAIVKVLKEKGYTNIIGKSHKELDLINQLEVQKFFQENKPEYVFLAAAKVGGIVANNKYRADFIYKNLMIQNNIIHESYKNQVKKLLFLGSTCIYPRDCPQPMKEEYLLTGTLEYTNEPYAIAKIAGIKLCESYNLQFGTNFISVMPTNLYGLNDNFDLEKSHVLPALIRKLHLGKCLENNKWEDIRHDLDKRPIEGVSGSNSDEDIVRILEKYGIKCQKNELPGTKSGHPSVSVDIWGSGQPMREFLWSEDMADACVHLMERVDFKELANRPFISNSKSPVELTQTLQSRPGDIRNTHINIGTGIEISIRNLAQLVSQITGFKGNLTFDTSKPDGTMRKLTDPSKLHELGWHHKVEMDEGIERIYNWYRA